MTKDKPYRPSFTIDSSIALLTNFCLLGTALMTSIIVSRALGPADKGLYSFLILLPTATVQVMNLGLSSANIYFLGRNRLASNQLVGNALLFSALFGGLPALTLLFLSPWIQDRFLAGINDFQIYLTVPLIPAMIFHESVHHFLLADRKMVPLSSVRIVQPLVYLLSLILFFYFDRISVVTALVAYVAGFLSSFLLGLFFLVRGRYFTSFSADLGLFLETIRFGLKQHIGTVFQVLNYRVDMVIIAALLTEADLGLYSIAVMIAEVVWRLPGSVATVLYAKIAADSDKPDARFTCLICRTTLLVTLLATLFLFFAAEILIPLLYSASFSPAVSAIQLLLPGILCLTMAKILNSFLVGSGFPGLPTLAAGISLVVMVPLDLLLIPVLGINGAALASSIAYLASGLLSLYFFQRTTRRSWHEPLLFRWSDLRIYEGIIRQLLRESGLISDREISSQQKPLDL